MVDAAIGGKTGVNLPEGKNLVGAFWQPAAVLCDTELLETLPEREWRSRPRRDGQVPLPDRRGPRRRCPLDERIARCVAIKADVVAGDEREAVSAGGPGRRALLNYGHTLAHALEMAGHHDLRHGEAVGIGLVFAAELAATLERIDAARVAEHREVVAGYGLDTELPPGLDRGRAAGADGPGQEGDRRAHLRARRPARRRGRRRGRSARRRRRRWRGWAVSAATARWCCCSTART